MNYQPTYLGEILLDEETLTHYGVKGMKWKRRKKQHARKKLIETSERIRSEKKSRSERNRAAYDRAGRIVKKSSLGKNSNYGNRGLTFEGARVQEPGEDFPGHTVYYTHAFMRKRRSEKK